MIYQADTEKKVLAIIQARMGSTRLPGKVLLPVNGKSVIERVIARVAKARLITQTIVATSDRESDQAIASLCQKLGIVCFRGSENNVLQRFFMAAGEQKANTIVRITADCPLLDTRLIDEVIETHFKHGNDYTANDAGKTYPRGMDVEVLSYAALAKAYNQATLPKEKEHVTYHIYNNLREFKVEIVPAPNNLARPNYRLCVDEEKDLALVREIYQHFSPGEHFSLEEIIAYLDDQPELTRINQNVQQKRV